MSKFCKYKWKYFVELPGRLLNGSWLIREGSPFTLLLSLSPCLSLSLLTLPPPLPPLPLPLSFPLSPSSSFPPCLSVFLRNGNESLKSHFGPWGALDDERHMSGCQIGKTEGVHSLMAILILLLLPSGLLYNKGELNWHSKAAVSKRFL